MHDARWWIAMMAFSLTTLVFVIAMFTFFRPTPGRLPQRLLLLGSMVAGLGLEYGMLWRRDTIDAFSLWTGCALLGLAHAFFWSALRAHGSGRPAAAFACEAPRVLTVQGAYRVVRHPFYVAYVLGFTAGAALSGSAWAWVVPVWMGRLYVVAAAQEERLILGSPQADAYRQYMRDVGALAPHRRKPLIPFS